MTETSLRPGPGATSAADLLGVALEPTGPRAGADTGSPETSLRELYVAADGSLDVGLWECTPGGWAIVDRPDTETVHILRGRGVITDADGTRHPLVPGTVVTLPRGWSGRWDIEETIRKLYVVSRPA